MHTGQDDRVFKKRFRVFLRDGTERSQLGFDNPLVYLYFTLSILFSVFHSICCCAVRKHLKSHVSDTLSVDYTVFLAVGQKWFQLKLIMQ